MNKVIAIGDIHGSTKWRNIIDGNKDVQIVFLGDYLDPYVEYDCDEILDNLIEIIDFKRNNKDRVVLLLGNHDLHYISSDAEICTRFDFRIARKAGILFIENFKLFQYAFQLKDIIFTHAGISQRWFEKDFKGNIEHNIADSIVINSKTENSPTDVQSSAIIS